MMQNATVQTKQYSMNKLASVYQTGTESISKLKHQTSK